MVGRSFLFEIDGNLGFDITDFFFSFLALCAASVNESQIRALIAHLLVAVEETARQHRTQLQ